MAELLQEPELLQEFSDSRGVTMSVDREVGILRGVKLIGLESRNGRRYREAALAEAATLYEESKVNVNHPKDGPLTPRDYQDRLGVIRNVELRTGKGLFGDLHFNPKHTLAEQLVWDAEHNPHNVGFSHNVLARLSRDAEAVVVEEITKVQSVDLVADPASTQGLFEHGSVDGSDAGNSDQRWDLLTIEVLQLHRPDLLDEIRAAESLELGKKLEQSEARTDALGRKQRIFELLCEHQISIANVQSTEDQIPQHAVSPMFVELLMNVSDDQELVSLIAERAELVRSACRNERSLLEASSAVARDQTLLWDRRLLPEIDAREFAATLKAASSN